ncbi:MAG: peptidase M14 family protein, partial [Candidatus Bathyarchaeia archaeon]
GCSLPRLYHKYTGHDNNRDALYLTQVETQMVSQVLYREWFPQLFIDYHQMGGTGARFYTPPYTNPIDEKVDPLIWTEQQLYGAQMAVRLEAAGKTGVENAASYPGDFTAGYSCVLCWFNICGTFTESASVRVATPVYVHYHQLEGSRRGRPEYRAQVNFPHPWPGGWWRLRDIVEQQKISALAALEVAASFREMILNNMYLKAMRSIRRGEEEPPYAFVIPPYQHDILAAHELLMNLRDLGVEIHRAKKSFTAGYVTYPAGSYVIFLSQTPRPFLLSLLPRTFYRDSPHTRTRDGTPMPPYDFAAQTMAEFMGVKVVEIEKRFEGEFEELDTIEFPRGSVEAGSGHGYLLDGRLNDSFKAVNRILKKGFKVFRADEEVKVGETTYPRGAFIIPQQEGIADVLREEAGELHLTFHALSSAPEFEKHEVKPLRVAMYQRYYGGNMDEGWTRWLLEQYEFPYTTVKDKEVKEGLKEYDVLILPSDATPMITGEKLEEYYLRRSRGRGVMPKVPPEYKSGIGKEGIEKVKEFVEAGGTLITLNQASEFAMEELKVDVFNALKDLKPNDFLCPGSTLKVNVDKTHPLAYGVAEDCLILFRGGSAFAVKPGVKGEDFEVVVSYPEEQILQSGWLIGEQHLSRRAALVEAKLGKGRVVLFGFSPQARAETHATFKFLFNVLLG